MAMFYVANCKRLPGRNTMKHVDVLDFTGSFSAWALTRPGTSGVGSPRGPTSGTTSVQQPSAAVENRWK
jgi:hypothetical protein